MPARARLLAAWIAGLVLAWSALPGCSSGPPDRPAGVVLVLFDTLRADRLSAYGNPRPTSPVFDGLAQRSALFEQAYGPAPWTLPSLIGLLSAGFPSQRVWSDDSLRISAVEALQQAGVATAAFTEGGFASARFGFAQGFDVYEEREAAVRLDPGSDAERGGIGTTFAAAQAWLRAGPPRPFFLWIHTYEPHTPYVRRFFTEGVSPGRLAAPTFELTDQMRIRRGELEPGPEDLAYVAALYDGGVYVCDGYLGRLLDTLEELGLADDTALIVTSDHGEDLGERDPRWLGEHGHTLHDELLRVPLLVHDPTGSFAAQRVASQVRILDVLPTVFELLGVAPPAQLEGRSLLPVLRGEETSDRLAFSRVTRKGRAQAAVRDGRVKWLRWLDTPGEDGLRLYDVRADPGERQPLAAAARPDARRARRQLDAFLEELERDGPLDFELPLEELSPELREQLRALGYLPEEP